MDVVRVTEEGLAVVDEVLRQLPRGEGKLRDQCRRSMRSIYLNLCEGLGRYQPADKARFYDIAHGSATETAGALRIVRQGALGDPVLIDRAEALLQRVACMLTRLAIVMRGRVRGGG